jgi:hypothetical protein
VFVKHRLPETANVSLGFSEQRMHNMHKPWFQPAPVTSCCCSCVSSGTLLWAPLLGAVVLAVLQPTRAEIAARQEAAVEQAVAATEIRMSRQLPVTPVESGAWLNRLMQDMWATFWQPFLLANNLSMWQVRSDWGGRGFTGAAAKLLPATAPKHLVAAAQDLYDLHVSMGLDKSNAVCCCTDGIGLFCQFGACSCTAAGLYSSI